MEKETIDKYLVAYKINVISLDELKRVLAFKLK